MGLELDETPTPSPPASPRPKLSLRPNPPRKGEIADCIGLLVVGALVYFDKVAPMSGLVLIALILSIRWPLKGGSAMVTALWPIVSMFWRGEDGGQS